MDIFTKIFAAVTRRFHLRGTERVIRLLYPPEHHQYVETIITLDNFRFHIDTRSFIEWYLFFKGDYEPRVASTLKKYLKPNDVAIDVGANIGIHTLLMARSVNPGMVYAIEPSPEIKRLELNVRENHCKNVVVVPHAFSSKTGKQLLYLPPDVNRGGASFYHPEFGQSMEVETVTLDDFARAEKLTRLDFIKIDVEGDECGVLEGGRESIEKFRPFVLFEYSPPHWGYSGRKFEDVKDFFAPLRYEFVWVDAINVLAKPSLK
ncbi:MAG: FkbM family methyltransferase [Candidatus Jorgensenbacteria bacterium]